HSVHIGSNGSDWFNMKLVTFSAEESVPRVGIADPDRDVVRDVTDKLPEGVGVLELIQDWQRYGPTLEGAQGLSEVPLNSVSVQAPIPQPRRDIICVGKNYREHVVEFGRSGYDSPDRSEALPEAPVVFPKMTTAVRGPYDDIESHL